MSDNREHGIIDPTHRQSAAESKSILEKSKGAKSKNEKRRRDQERKGKSIMARQRQTPSAKGFIRRGSERAFPE